ncbi:hypothetical protein EMIHUDRAFT_239435 [Emiliania huxleyi CCMP1516]|uniref:C2H2-type domain-containing protein n=2 Tax=Emiliania huxleyi TaxID=2903 RepID=A0A0D3JJC8_EMIH1|nr:hypothetical protein EMIHUDRAFT_239435 [Emiliania huxleyi CCMP1516]EOD23613.1 hypothetical protein EMIHUDRAFT_239435 [Emiliania huxleyi CCMP1516]|eukprot:XP_005776042.1 hypothetical protein EMIHUDRAFT_239435 [Emiliania huxleyi CCMP1516]
METAGSIKVGGRGGGTTKNGGRIWAHDWENSVVDPLGERSSQTVALGLTMSSSGASASAATMQRHQEQRRADTSALADAARGQRQMPELPPYEAAVDIALQLLTDGEGLQALHASDEPSAESDNRSSRLLLLPQQQSAAALIRKLMTSSTAGGIRAATAGSGRGIHCEHTWCSCEELWRARVWGCSLCLAGSDPFTIRVSSPGHKKSHTGSGSGAQ